MNILIGKIGKSVKFKNLDIMYGDDAPAVFYSTMSRILPEHNFYFCGPSDFNKLTQKERDFLFPNKNVFSCFRDGYPLDENDPELISYDSIVDYLEEQNIKIDFALIFIGYCGNHVICNCTKNPKTGKYYIILNAFKRYAGPYVNTINKLGCPFYTIAEDARYLTVNTAEMFNRERYIFTQCTERYLTPLYPHITSYDDHTFITDSKVKCGYGGVEKIFMMALDKKWKEKIDIERKLSNTKNPKCIVLSNGHGANKLNTGAVVHNARLNEYKKYVVDNFKGTEFENTKIYGIWDDEIYEKYPMIQKKGIVDLGDEIADAKYTFVYSIIPGFVTVKAYEMITLGLIPFLHPDYDKDNLLQLPKFLYTTGPDDFLKKIETLERHPDKYQQLLNRCFECIKPEYLDGSYLVNNIMSKIADDLGFEYKEHKGVEPILDHFNKNIVNPAESKKTDNSPVKKLF